MKCKECEDYAECHKKNNLTKKRHHCAKATADAPKCEHIIGMLYDYEETRLVNLDDLKEEINRRERLNEDELLKGLGVEIRAYSLADYADRRKRTNLFHFDYCPDCGAKIDWAAIRRMSNERA